MSRMRTNDYGTRILAKDITISNDTWKTGLNNNDLIIGTSGSGKTGGYVIPNIENLTGSLVVSDTKGNLARNYTKFLKDRGYEVYTLDFVNPMKSCGYNPLRCIRHYQDGSYCEQDVLTLANTMMPVLDTKEPFWEKAAAGYIAFLIAYVLEVLPPDEQNMISVCKLHRTMMKSKGKPSFILWADEGYDSFAVKKYEEFSGSRDADRMWASINEFATRALELFDFRETRHIFESKNCINIRNLGRRKTVLFLNSSDTDRTFDNLVNVFYTQALQNLCTEADHNEDSRLKVPVRIIMDDFATSTRIPDFDKIISVIRSREISVSLIIQSLTQLASLYDPAVATTIINNCDHLLYLGGQDKATAEFISYRALKTPESVMCMPRDKVYLLTNGERAKLVDKIKPYSTVKTVRQSESLRERIYECRDFREGEEQYGKGRTTQKAV